MNGGPMLLREIDLRRVAERTITEHGPEAVAEAERLASQSTEMGAPLTAATWLSIRTIIVKLQRDRPGQRSRA